MEMTGEFRIPAPQEKVWDALNDADVLRQAIPGAETVEKVSDTEFSAVAKAKVGPVSAKFKGNVTLSNIDAPNGYTISGEGSGGAAGFAKGSAVVKLTPDGDGTLLSYEVKATVGGKLAQVGQRFIDSTAKKMADEFFTSFAAITGGETEQVDAIAPTHVPMLPDEEAGLSLSPWMWGTVLIAGALVGIYLFTM
ncbi:MAG: carbon monoxide dehydrogenase subunit G [Alphaproteobacteria bacterium]|jgi:hypothetical protein|nr:carbon monoxide dehydrogenase subunit G [Alphaproteobacteria bacterium]MBO6629113.1 carbon monoxide dehydrogenase subunit G [Alphaproteobacteria bacterium]MDF1624884.1 carbon monoxide dehydrogenase subunit G [Parvibaculaceae bacterium]